jgi:hypothetical protein
LYLNADPDPDPGEQTNAVPDSGPTLPSQKIFEMKNKLNVGNTSENVPTWVQRAILKSRKSGLFSCMPLLLNPDPHSQYGSGSETLSERRFCFF